jgi:hypothetical protein
VQVFNREDVDEYINQLYSLRSEGVEVFVIIIQLDGCLMKFIIHIVSPKDATPFIF